MESQLAFRLAIGPIGTFDGMMPDPGLRDDAGNPGAETAFTVPAVHLYFSGFRWWALVDSNH